LGASSGTVLPPVRIPEEVQVSSCA